MTENATHHVSVLLDEIIEFLSHVPDADSGLFLDATLGGGGHTEALLESFPRCFVLALDRDPEAVERATKRFEKFEGRMHIEHLNFADLAQHAEELESIVEKKRGRKLSGLSFDGMVLDLGLSSDQLDDPNRGFSFLREGPLDMRMDRSHGVTAAEILNSTPQARLQALFRTGGLRRGVVELTRAIVEARPLITTMDFVRVCDAVLGSPRERRLKAKRGGTAQHPATVAFQALRVAVNNELHALERFLSDAPKFLAPQGRLCVLSFHSLEDEIATGLMRSWQRSASVPRGLAATPKKGLGKVLTPKAVLPKDSEQESNPRARSARLRVFQRYGTNE